MRNLTAEIRAFLRDEEGVTMIEYVLIAALIAVFLIAGFQLDQLLICVIKLNILGGKAFMNNSCLAIASEDLLNPF